MPIIMPTFPEQNVGANLNAPMAKVILSELRTALKQIKNNQNLTETIISPLKGGTFTEKYAHFIVIDCSGPQINIGKFSQFVGKRILYELHKLIKKSSKLANRVDFLHIYPTEASTERHYDELNRLNVVKKWLVGIKLFEALDNGGSEFKSALKEMLKSFDIRIKKDFNRFLFYSVKLTSEYVEANDLAAWGIDQEI
uniref:DUF2662 domain-containing protein n=1 Tax=Globodera pallida TaxID=36090 RepID=A0A183BSN1_GLOPA